MPTPRTRREVSFLLTPVFFSEDGSLDQVEGRGDKLSGSMWFCGEGFEKWFEVTRDTKSIEIILSTHCPKRFQQTAYKAKITSLDNGFRHRGVPGYWEHHLSLLDPQTGRWRKVLFDIYVDDIEYKLLRRLGKEYLGSPTQDGKVFYVQAFNHIPIKKR